jgi:UDP-N-acetylmuramoyl-L-alanyl-D-glutamate--2,6-diaminopimelate ligase
MRPITPYSLTLDEIARAAGAVSSTSAQLLAKIGVSGVTHSDKAVVAGDLFLALPGANFHGAEFAASAHSAGAVAVLTDKVGREIFDGLPVLVVANPREVGAQIAASLYRHPMRELHTIGVTGTNGKTTVTTLLAQLFQAAGRDCGLIGTVETRIGKDSFASARTTPEASDLQALAATMRERHMRHLVMEVSSHAIAQSRMKGSHFAIVGFTNLSQDHLDFHGSMDEYFAAKAKLFTFEYADLGFINIDDSYGAKLFNSAEIPVVSISRDDTKAQWHYVSYEADSLGNQLSLRGTGGVLIEAHTVLRGGYNLDNLAMAVAIACESGVDPVDIANIIPSLTGAEGRMENVSLGQGFSALVDYAHSPSAVENVLKSAQGFTKGRVIAVLGCGGDRDASKRPLMGKALADGADVCIFTSDNPRSEDPDKILNQMVEGVSYSDPSKLIADRRDAIAYAVSLAQSGDCVLILGKGHEKGQEIKGTIHPFDDRLVLAEEIEAKG